MDDEFEGLDYGQDLEEWTRIEQWQFRTVMPNASPEKQKTVRYLYARLEAMCTTGLEALMLVGLCAQLYERKPDKKHDVLHFIRPQYPVGWCKLDFLITPWPEFSDISFGVECDGEVWHQNKKKDEARDAFIRSQGIKQIYRFPGADIKADAQGCAARAFQQFDEFAKKQWPRELVFV